MKLAILFLITSLSFSIKADIISENVICSGGAVLDGGSVITVGQPIVGFAFGSAGTGISFGLIPPHAVTLPERLSMSQLRLSGETFSFEIESQIRQSYWLEISTNLTSWMRLPAVEGTGVPLQFAPVLDFSDSPLLFLRVGTDY
jgi:hypothetical protein